MQVRSSSVAESVDTETIAAEDLLDGIKDMLVKMVMRYCNGDAEMLHCIKFLSSVESDGQQSGDGLTTNHDMQKLREGCSGQNKGDERALELMEVVIGSLTFG